MLLPEPIDVPITDKVAFFLKAARIYTASDVDYARNGNTGWLEVGKILRFHRKISVESNCAFYGGPYRGMLNMSIPSSGFCTMGFFSFSSSPLPEPLSVGRYCSISFGLNFIDIGHPANYVSTSCFNIAHSNVCRMLGDGLHGAEKFQADWSSDGRPYPEIGHDVWIGYNATLAMGIKIGTGAIIAANATVTRDVPPYAVVGGNPAQVRKYRFGEDDISALLNARWWEFTYPNFAGLPMAEPKRFVEQLLEREAKGEARRFTPKKFTFPDFFDVVATL